MIALIPARSGSTRVPSKNTRSFSGRPLCAWSIEAAVSSQCFTDVRVSTDDPEVARVASKLARVHLRHPALAQSDTSMRETLLGFVLQEGVTDDICVLYPTYPLRTADDIKVICDAWQTTRNAPSMVGYVAGGPIDRAVNVWRDGNMAACSSTYRTQDESALHTEGNVYCHFACVVKPMELCSLGRNLIGDSTHGMSLNDRRERCFEVDTFGDWELAEAVKRLGERV